MRNEIAKGVLEKMLEDYEERFSENDISALKTAIESLEKQIPKYLYVERETGYYCPSCDSPLREFLPSFCRNCGQALKYEVR